MTIDPYYLCGFIALSWAAAFGLGRFIRAGQGPREMTAWERATRGEQDFGRNTLEPATHPDASKGGA